jgi:(2R)-3-sulfolactate dehydrogenase (NADP+)
MLPSGGYKGFGAGLLVEVMAAALAGASLGLEASPFSGTKGGPPKTGQCFIALDPGHYSDNTFSEKIGDLCVAISQQEGARLPGSRRIANRHRLEVDGVEVEDSLLQKIHLS